MNCGENETPPFRGYMVAEERALTPFTIEAKRNVRIVDELQLFTPYQDREYSDWSLCDALFEGVLFVPNDRSKGESPRFYFVVTQCYSKEGGWEGGRASIAAIEALADCFGAHSFCSTENSPLSIRERVLSAWKWSKLPSKRETVTYIAELKLSTKERSQLLSTLQEEPSSHGESEADREEQVDNPSKKIVHAISRASKKGFCRLFGKN